MKKLYTFYDDAIEGTVFVDDHGKYVGWLHEQEANYDCMRMNFIPKFFDGEIVELFSPDLISDNPENDLAADPFTDEETIREWCERNVDLLMEAIRLREEEILSSGEQSAETDDEAPIEAAKESPRAASKKKISERPIKSIKKSISRKKR